jgi:hypothetical protein
MIISRTGRSILGGQNMHFIEKECENKRPMFWDTQRAGVHGGIDQNG